MQPGAALAAATPALLDLRRALLAQEATMRGLHQRRAAERAAAAAGTAAGRLYDPDPDCCVCYEPLDKPNAVVTECGHVYHRACIENAFASSRPANALRAGCGGNCPICRRWIDTASLVKINNGLPTKREFAIAAVESDEDEEAGGGGGVVVDLDSWEDGGSSQGSGDSDAAIPPRNANRDDDVAVVAVERRARPRRKCGTVLRASADEATRAMDVEIVHTLRRGNEIMAQCSALVAMERALADEVDATRAKCRAAEEEAAAVKKEAVGEVARAKVEMRVKEVRLEELQKKAFDDRRELAEQIAVARRRNDELLIQIRNGEQAIADANAEKEKAEEERAAQEARRERFAKLAASYEAKRTAIAEEKVVLRELQRENKVLRKQIEALRKQLRKATNQPPPPQELERREDLAVPTLDLGIFDVFTDAAGVAGDENAGGTHESEEDDDEDDDVVAAADAQFNTSVSRLRQGGGSGSKVSPGESPADRVKFAQGVFGHLLGPSSAQGAAQPTRPPPPPSLRRRARPGAGAVGLAAYRPADAPPPPKLGPIGALGPVVRALGVKRSFASPRPATGNTAVARKRIKQPAAAAVAAAAGHAVSTKKRNSKINSFFQPK